MNLKNGDCIKLMKEIPDKSVDLLICDLPYGETNCKSDTCIDMEEFWKEFRRIRKSKRVACIHFCSTKFGYSLIKSWEKGFKMDMVWKKRNKTGGLQSRSRPMRNHEMVYFFYEQAPKYNRDKYHKRIAGQNVCGKKKRNEHGFNSEGQSNHGLNSFEPPNPASVVEEKYTKVYLDNNRAGAGTNNQSTIFSKKNRKEFQKENGVGFEPPNPASVIEESAKTIYNIDKDKTHPKGNGQAFEPPNPASVIEMDPWGCKNGGDKGSPYGLKYEPPNPASVVEEETENLYGMTKEFLEEKGNTQGTNNFEPPNPASVFDSKKVFIGKRHHQTEKPLDIIEFFLKYWSDEGDTILDPTMGSGSTGVACKTLGRNFIGYELDPKIFEVAKKRLQIDENVVEI